MVEISSAPYYAFTTDSFAFARLLAAINAGPGITIDLIGAILAFEVKSAAF